MEIYYPPDLKDRIARVLSEILSDKYDCKITIRFVPVEEIERKERQVKPGTKGHCMTLSNDEGLMQ